MAKKRARKTTTATMLDKLAVAAGSRLGQVAARIDKLTKQRNTITAEIQRYARQAESALRGLASGTSPSARKATAKRVAKRKSAAKKRRTTKT
jgi:hypothetical protein